MRGLVTSIDPVGDSLRLIVEDSVNKYEANPQGLKDHLYFGARSAKITDLEFAVLFIKELKERE